MLDQDSRAREHECMHEKERERERVYEVGYKPKMLTSAKREPTTGLLLLSWLFSVKLLCPEGAFLNKSKGTLAKAEKSPETDRSNSFKIKSQ